MKIARHVDVRATAQAIGRATRLDAEVVLVVLRRTDPEFDLERCRTWSAVLG